MINSLLHAYHVDFILFVCLWVYRPTGVIFHLYGDVTFTGEGLQILTDARHSWQLSSEGSLGFHTYCDTGHPFITFISEDPWHLNLLPSVKQSSYNYVFLHRFFNCVSRYSIHYWKNAKYNLFKVLKFLA